MFPHFLFPVAGQSGVCDTTRVLVAGAGLADPAHTHSHTDTEGTHSQPHLQIYAHTHTPVSSRTVVQILFSNP